MREASIQAAIVRHCKERGLMAMKLASPSNRGVPDLIVIGYQKVVFIEVKKPGGKLSALQVRFMGRLRELGMDSYVVSDIVWGKELVDSLFPLLVGTPVVVMSSSRARAEAMRARMKAKGVKPGGEWAD